jgi:hypothetical protein
MRWRTRHGHCAVWFRHMPKRSVILEAPASQCRDVWVRSELGQYWQLLRGKGGLRIELHEQGGKYLASCFAPITLLYREPLQATDLEAAKLEAIEVSIRECDRITALAQAAREA